MVIRLSSVSQLTIIQMQIYSKNMSSLLPHSISLYHDLLLICCLVVSVSEWVLTLENSSSFPIIPLIILVLSRIVCPASKMGPTFSLTFFFSAYYLIFFQLKLIWDLLLCSAFFWFFLSLPHHELSDLVIWGAGRLVKWKEMSKRGHPQNSEP